MQPRIRYNHWLFKLPGMGVWNGIVLYPYVLFRSGPEKVSERLMNHEMVHFEQVQRDGFFTFYLKYLWYQARYGYMFNPYEIEARERSV